MVAWYYIPIALIAGIFAGVFLLALVSANRE